MEGMKKHLSGSGRWFRRVYYRLLWLSFSLFQPLVKEFREQPCYWRSIFFYNSLPPELQAQSTINILLDVVHRREPKGHVWVNVAGKNYHKFLGKPMERWNRMEQVGADGIFQYWVLVPGEEILNQKEVHA